MSDYVIATASTCDLDAQYLAEHNVPFIPYTFIINGKEYTDDCTDQTKDLILNEMNQDQSVSTAAVTIYAYTEFFESFLKEGKDVIFLDMTKSISSSYNNSLLAKRELEEKYPERKITIVDTNCVTLILGLLLKDAIALKEAGKSYDEVVSYVEETKNHLVGRFMVNDLKWLRRGGRLSNSSAIVGSLLSIKPIIIVDDEGKLVAYNKVRGRAKCIRTLIEDTKKSIIPESYDHEVAIIYSGEKEDGEKFKEEFTTTFPEFKNVQLYRLGPVIMGHIGPGFLATVMYGSARNV